MLNTFKSRFSSGKTFQRQLLLFFIIIITPIIFSISGFKCDCGAPGKETACTNATVPAPTKNVCVYSFTLNVTGTPSPCAKQFKIAVTSGGIIAGAPGQSIAPVGWTQTESGATFLVYTPEGGGTIRPATHGPFVVTISGAASTDFNTFLLDNSAAINQCTLSTFTGTCP